MHILQPSNDDNAESSSLVTEHSVGLEQSGAIVEICDDFVLRWQHLLSQIH